MREAPGTCCACLYSSPLTFSRLGKRGGSVKKPLIKHRATHWSPRGHLVSSTQEPQTQDAQASPPLRLSRCQVSSRAQQCERQAGCRVPGLALPRMPGVTLGKPLCLSGPQFPHMHLGKRLPWSYSLAQPLGIYKGVGLQSALGRTDSQMEMVRPCSPTISGPQAPVSHSL